MGSQATSLSCVFAPVLTAFHDPFRGSAVQRMYPSVQTIRYFAVSELDPVDRVRRGDIDPRCAAISRCVDLVGCGHDDARTAPLVVCPLIDVVAGCDDDQDDKSDDVLMYP